MRRALALVLLSVAPLAGCTHAKPAQEETAVEVHGRILTEGTEQFEGADRPAPGASDAASTPHGSCARHAARTAGERADGDAGRPHAHDGCRCGDAEHE